MVSAPQLAKHNLRTHAVAKDFCRIFEQEMNGLYLLSFLLTSDKDLAEKCFVGGLGDSVGNPRVFRHWAHSWARRMVIQNAIQMLRPQAGQGCAPSRGADGDIATLPEIVAVVELPAFERFVFVMSLLERYSDQYCALLLRCTRGEVIAARVRALQQVGSSAEERLALVTGKLVPGEIAGMGSEIDSARHLVTSA